MKTLVAPGVWTIRFGEPESVTPISLQEIPADVSALNQLPAAKLPFDTDTIQFATSKRGCVVEIPMDSAEQIYGFGLQLKSLNQTGKKRTIRVNSDPTADTGDSHAPVPFYASTAGYGVLIDTTRYALVNVGSHVKVGTKNVNSSSTVGATGTSEIYKPRELSGKRVIIDIPTARGVDVYIFAGPDLRSAVQRYNLFSGGGCLPPMWGLGVWYRAFGSHDQATALQMAQEFRAEKMPIDVFGLEPGWQSKAYACSFQWETQRFPSPPKFIAEMRQMGFELNLWEHVFVHPTSPMYESLKPQAGDYEVWGGIIPDLTQAASRRTFAGHHDEHLISQGIGGFKLDECDSSDFTPWYWSFPEATQFPSGLDGEQMHSILGLQYQRTLYEVHRKHNRRTYSAVRASHALAAPYPYVLYSDLYDHRDFVRGVCTMGFGGLLWTPEVREGGTVEGLIRRIQSTVMSPQALINAWYIKSPPWHHVEIDKNNLGEKMSNWQEVQDQVRSIFELRMRLIPYLYAAFARYRSEGLPPFRAMAMDWPGDANTHKLDDQYMMGDSILVAPVFAEQASRKIYLPAGEWFDFHTHQRHIGGQTIDYPAELSVIPMFVKSGTILPLADPVQHVTRDTVFELTCLIFGENPQATTLWEDDGETFDFERGDYNLVKIEADRMSRTGSFNGERYRVREWQRLTEK